jgi:FkbM family methyltransferase
MLCNRLMQPAWQALQKLSLFGMNYGGGNSLEDSGELWVLKKIGWVLLHRTPHAVAVIFDVGANRGDYAAAVREVFGDDVRLLCFEPSPTAFAALRRNLGTTPGVLLNNVGLSDREGTANLYTNAPGSVISSIHPGETTLMPSMNLSEECRLTTLDRYCEENAIGHIDFLKIDSEGNEYNILLGARQLMTAEAIDYIQFEFGPPQINARSFFRDLFKLLAPRYRIYRVLRVGLTPIDTYDEIREVFRTTNYLAVAQRLGGILR